MFKSILAFLKAPEFLDDDEKTRRARALHALQLNIGSAILVLGSIGVLFFFAEKLITSIILVAGFLVTIFGMILNRRGRVKVSGMIMLFFLWCLTVLMAVLSSGIQSLDIMFFVSGTVIAGIILGPKGTYYYAGLSLLTGLGLILIGNTGFDFPHLFTFPPATAWVLLFINLVFTVVPLQVALQSLSDSAARAHASEERYRMIASVMSDYAFSVRYGPTGEIIDQWISGAFETITGYTPNEYYSRGGWSSILHPDDKEQDESDMSQLRNKKKVITEVRVIRKDGKIRWVRSYGHPIWDEKNDHFAGIYGAVQDITDRKIAETGLSHRETILKVMVDAANTFLKISEWPTATWQAEVDNLLERLGATIDASHAYIFENHVSKDGLLQMSMRYEWTASGFWSDISNPKYNNMPLDEDYMENWNQSVFHGVPYIGDDKHASPEDMADLRSRGIQALLDVPIYVNGVWWGTIGFDDMTHPREWSSSEVGALVIAANLLGAVIERREMDSVLQDELRQRKSLINELEKRNAESETLRESAAIVAATLERAEAIPLILEQMERVVPYKSASVQLINENMLEIVSSKGLETTNGDIGVRFPLDENEPAYPVIRNEIPYILFNDVQVSVPTFNEFPHNNIRAWMAVPLKVKGKIMGIISLDGERVDQFTSRDAELAVTYANQVAIALENSRLFSELQMELALKQRLIDELENKNAELERFTYTVSHDFRSPLVTIRGFLGYLEKSVIEGNMESFRKDLARIGNATLRMDALLKDVLELSRIGRLINKPQDVPFGDLVQDALEIVHGQLEKRGVTLQIHPNLPIVHVDKLRLIEVLQNLIDNAAKYMGDQKKPSIEIGMDGYDNSGHPVFFVRDNGMGIAPEYHERIFGLFNKLDARSEGTGIGLALVKRIIEFHGCRIWVRSEAGIAGSTFCFTLPLSGTKEMV